MMLRNHDICGYPLFYVHPYGHGAYCNDCINADIVDEDVNPDEVTPAINWENDELYCASCGKLIASAYGGGVL
jgi:hypothetical protein